jgi:hypothetical protein
MAHVLIPPLPRGARKSDYVPVEERLRTRKRQNADKGKARAGDNSGSTALVHALQGAFENNWGTKKIPTPLDQALSAAFTHNSANPKVLATSSGNTRRRAETVSDSTASVELIIPSSTRTHARARRGKRHLHTSSSPRRKRRRITKGNDSSDDEHEQDNSDDEVEIVVDAPRSLRRVPKAKPPKHKQRASSPLPTSNPISVHTSTTPTPSPQQPSSPITPPNVNSLAGLPLTFLPAPARAAITIPPRALSHLHAFSPGAPDPRAGKVQQMHQQAIRQGFCCEGTAAGAHGLLASPIPAAAEPTPATMDSGACATTTTTTDPGLQHASIDLHLDLDVSMDLEDEPADADADARSVHDDVVVPPPPLHPLLRTHDHPDGPMLGFMIPEHDGADADAALSHAFTSPDRDLDFEPITSLSASAAPSDGWVDWRAGHVLGGTSAGTDTGVIGEYAGNGTIDPSVLGGGGGNCAEKADEYSSSPVRRFRDGGAQLSRATTGEGGGVDDEEEDDVMGLLFQNASDDDFVPPSGSGKGKGKGKGRLIESPDCVSPATAAGARIRRKSWRKALADEAEVEHRVWHSDDDGDGDGDGDKDDGPRAHPLSAPAFLPPRPSSSKIRMGQPSFCHHCRSRTRRPKMRCTMINESTHERCAKLFCDRCIENRYARTHVFAFPYYSY